MNNLIIWAKAQVNRSYLSPPLRAGILKNRQLMGFSPKSFIFFLNSNLIDLK